MNERIVVSERKTSEIKNRFRITSIMIALAVMCLMIAASLIPFLASNSSNDSQPVQKAHISTITGTPYPGSGDWNTGTNPVIYDGTDLTVYGTITTGAGGLTIKNCKLTIDLATPDEHYILVNQGFFRAIYATVTASNTTAGKTDSSISAVENSHIYLSNSTIEHFKVEPYASGDYIDNNTMDSSIIACPVPSNLKNRINISYNDFTFIYQGYVMYGFPPNSVITGNTIHDTCVQEYSGGTNGWIDVFGNGGLSDGSVVIKNHIEANCAYQGISLYDTTDVYVAFNTIDTVERTWNISDHPGKMCAGIYLIGDGTDSLVTRNIVRRVDAWEALNGSHAWGDTGVNIGIAGKYDAVHWQVTYNQIWFVGGAGPTTCYGINYQGSHANIDHNNMTWVGVEQGPYSGSNPAGIMVEGDYNGIFGVTNANHYDYVNSTWNTISTVYAASNGITYGWGATVNDYVRNCWISNNTVGTVIYNSGGIGIYIHARYITVVDNHVTDVKHDSYGLGMGCDVINSIVSRNYVHVTTPGGYSPVGIPNNLYFGAFCSGDEGYANTLRDTVISYNHMVIDTRVVDGVSYPEYAMMGLNNNTVANRPIFIVIEPSIFSYMDSTFQVKADFGVPDIAGYNLNGNPTSSTKIGNFYVWNQTDPNTIAQSLLVGSIYLHIGYNLVRADADMSIDWTHGSSASLISVVTDVNLIVNVTTWDLSAIQIASWTTNLSSSNATVTFTLSGLDPGSSYTVYVDGEAFQTLVSNLSGAFAFTYSGSGTHDFYVELSDMQKMINMLWPILNIAIIMMVISIVLGFVLGPGKGKK